jgi:hypothetical protein
VPRDLTPLEPPGEDTLDLPVGLAWFVAACTWMRHVILAFRETPRGPAARAPLPALTRSGAGFA